MVAIHREKVVISRYEGCIVTDGRLIEKNRAKVEGEPEAPYEVVAPPHRNCPA
jgi:hypothetical protein